MKNKKNREVQNKHKFNLIDVIAHGVTLLIVLVALILVFDPWGWINGPEVSTQEKTVLCVVEVNDVQKSHIRCLKDGQKAIFMTSGVDTGRIVDVERVPYSKWHLSEDKSEMVLVKDETKETYYVTVQIDCIYKEGVGYFLHDTQLLVGNQIDLKFTLFDAVGKCVSITEQE